MKELSLIIDLERSKHFHKSFQLFIFTNDISFLQNNEDIQLYVLDLYHHITSLQPCKAPGPDKIPSMLLIIASSEIVLSRTFLPVLQKIDTVYDFAALLVVKYVAICLSAFMQ